ncbi:MAG: hypothetical protein RJA22_3373 [Verrucomicrobiota bacterium]
MRPPHPTLMFPGRTGRATRRLGIRARGGACEGHGGPRGGAESGSSAALPHKTALGRRRAGRSLLAALAPILGLALTLLGAPAPVRGQGTSPAAAYVAGNLTPPPLTRELRGTWIASVKNIDWPSRPGLSTTAQKAELLDLLNLCQQLQLNAIFLQVRPACDALYESALEPWSEYLTGVMGRAPQPFYDPLAFAIQEAHRRGLELHAWINPFRARHASSTAPFARTHLSQARPGLVKAYGKSLWLDPGDPAAREHSLRVILDLVSRYDLDGLHFDDYFYPYEERDRQGRALPFPDDATWQRYVQGGGKLDRKDWRRENVNGFVRQVQERIRATKPWVRYGISPFGIWRPNHPPGIKGLDAHDTLYADARRWLREGWVDYLAPQLYWKTSAREQSFPVLLQWWSEQNVRGRQLFTGLAQRNGSDEILSQIAQTRRQAGAGGQIHWSARALQEESRTTQLRLRQSYAQPALPPVARWLDATPPARPTLGATAAPRGGVRFLWGNGGAEPVRFWVVQARAGGQWSTDIVAAGETARTWASAEAPEALAVTAIDRAGNAGAPAVIQRGTPRR